MVKFLASGLDKASVAAALTAAVLRAVIVDPSAKLFISPVSGL